MIADLRKLADDLAQTTFKLSTDRAIKTREWDPPLVAIYTAAENLVTAIDDYYQELQAADPEAPEAEAPVESEGTYLGSRCCGAGGSTPHWYLCPSRFTPSPTIVEAESRALWGDR